MAKNKIKLSELIARLELEKTEFLSGDPYVEIESSGGEYCEKTITVFDHNSFLEVLVLRAD
jgi:hypothetical protein